MATYDGSNLKQTEYDFPRPLLDKANVTTTKAADQPVYNSDLAKVTNQAINTEQDERKQADAAEQTAREQADSKLETDKVEGIASGTTKAINLGSDFAASGTDITIADKAITTNKLADDVNTTIGAAVTAPSTTATTPNMLDTDIFETQEVNGQTGVTLKAGAITNEYLGEKSITNKNLYSNIIYPSELYMNPYSYERKGYLYYDSGSKPTSRNNLYLLMETHSTGMYKSFTVDNTGSFSTDAIYCHLDNKTFPYTNKINYFTYNSPTAGIASLVERYNLVSFGILSLILVQAVVTYSAAADAYVTLTKDKVWTDYYKGVTDVKPTNFAPFLIAEAPTNPSAVTTSLVHDDTNGYRMQLHSDTAGEYECEYVLGNIDTNLFTNPFTW